MVTGQTQTSKRQWLQDRHEQVNDSGHRTDTNKSTTVVTGQTRTSKRQWLQDRHKQANVSGYRTDTNKQTTVVTGQTQTSKRQWSQDRHEQVNDSGHRTDTNQINTSDYSTHMNNVNDSTCRTNTKYKFQCQENQTAMKTLERISVDQRHHESPRVPMGGHQWHIKSSSW